MHHVLRRLTLALLSVALFATPAHAQTVGSVSQTTGITQSICRIGNGAGVAGRLWGVGSPAGKCGKPVNGLEVSVVDASALGDCSTGGGTYVTTCAYNSAASGANKWSSPAPAGGGGGGTPGGSNSQVQINSSGAFSGSANLTWNGTNLVLGGVGGGFKVDPDPSSGGAYYFTVTNDPAAQRVILFDDAGSSNQVVFKTASQVLTNKTIDAAVNTVSGIGTANITDGSVALADLANLSAATLMGRDSGAGSGVPQALTVGGGLEFTGAGGIQRSALTGDVTASAGSSTTAIASGVIVNADVNASAAIAGTKLANTPAGGIAATTVQAAVNELDTEKLNVSDAISASSVIQKDGSVAFTANQPHGGFIETGLGAGSATGHSARYDDIYETSATSPLRAGLPMAWTRRLAFAYPGWFSDFEGKESIQRYTNSVVAKSASQAGVTATTAYEFITGAAATTFDVLLNGGGSSGAVKKPTGTQSINAPIANTGVPDFVDLWTLTEIGTTPTGYTIAVADGWYEMNAGSANSKGVSYRKAGEYGYFVDGSASDPTLNATIFEARFKIRIDTAAPNWVAAFGLSSAGGAILTTTGATTGTNGAQFIVSTDMANRKATVKFDVRRSSATTSTAITTAYATTNSIPADYTDGVEVSLGFRCYGLYTSNSGHCLVYVNGAQVADVTTLPNIVAGSGLYPHFDIVNLTGGVIDADTFYNAIRYDYAYEHVTKVRN